MDDFLENFRHLFGNINISLNKEQEKFISFLSTYYLELKDFFHKPRRKFLFYKSKKPKNLYLYGVVGIGKSVILKNFVVKIIEDEILPADSILSIHLHQFLLMIHNRLNDLRHSQRKREDILGQIVKEIANKVALIYLDEFVINDIVDAMIIGKLLKEIERHNIIILTSSNFKPNELYKDGIQRESFLESINFISENFILYHLSSTIDYRALKEHNTQIIKIIHSHAEGEAYLNSVLGMLDINSLHQKKLHFLGRDLEIKRFNNDFVIFTFDELFVAEMGNYDYKHIVDNFKLIFIENIRAIQNEEKNILRRFINFIDIVFEAKVKLLMTTYVDLKKLYITKNTDIELKRLLSRLDEISSLEYSAHK